MDRRARRLRTGTLTRRLGASLLAATWAVLAAACADPVQDDGTLRCDTETRADIYAPDMMAVGNDGLFRIRLLESVPGPPEKGDNNFTIELLEGGADVAVPDATLSVTPFMPDHNHGTSIVPTVTPATQAGQYEIDRINLWMPGLWEVRIDVDDQTDTDEVVFSFCIEG